MNAKGILGFFLHFYFLAIELASNGFTPHPIFIFITGLAWKYYLTRFVHKVPDFLTNSLELLV